MACSLTGLLRGLVLRLRLRLRRRLRPSLLDASPSLLLWPPAAITSAAVAAPPGSPKTSGLSAEMLGCGG